jgi:hypothetical protein
MICKSARSRDENIGTAGVRGERDNERHKKKSTDLEKATILLAWACRVYGPDADADEAEYKQFLRIGCAIAKMPPETLARVSKDEVVAFMLAEDRLEAERLLARPQRGRGRPATHHKHLWIMGTIEAYMGLKLSRKAAVNRAAEKWGLSPTHIDWVYKKNKEPQTSSKGIRAFFDAKTPDEVDMAIEQFLRNERGCVP